MTDHLPRALVITAPGINCDQELAHAFACAGARPRTVLLSELARSPGLVDDYQLIGLPGGFSYGDDIAAGRIMGALIRRTLYPALAAAIERGVPMICPCNGFQIAVQSGLLPGPKYGAAWPTQPAAPVIALAQNEAARFHDGWTRVHVPANTRCVWTQGLEAEPHSRPHDDRTFALPSAHGEGRLVADDALLDALQANGQVALLYHEADHFNGSMRRIAGICDASGLVLGLMPHPERFTRWTQHPTWTRLSDAQRSAEPLGLRMFRSAVSRALVSA
ncbi:MAG: phosphoribosylformylglycinamidine synthase subunit PurQ [Phycisphaerae bacterium]|nr:phosphoribosylformylglycinamidine synthase subunit PurQ [Phycisphaerae bacterium]